MSSSVRRTRAAATFSTTWATLEVPGMGKMTGDRARSQADATCDGVTFFRAATRRRGLSASVSWPAANGNHGMKTATMFALIGFTLLRDPALCCAETLRHAFKN